MDGSEALDAESPSLLKIWKAFLRRLREVNAILSVLVCLWDLKQRERGVVERELR